MTSDLGLWLEDTATMLEAAHAFFPMGEGTARIEAVKLLREAAGRCRVAKKTGTKKRAPLNATRRNVRPATKRDDDLEANLLRTIDAFVRPMREQLKAIERDRKADSNRIASLEGGRQQIDERLSALEGMQERQTEVINSLGEPKV